MIKSICNYVKAWYNSFVARANPVVEEFVYEEQKDNLIKAGWKIHIFHERAYKGCNDCWTRNHFENSIRTGEQTYKDSVLQGGGTTGVRLTSPSGEQYEGFAQCSKHDQFSRKIGRTIALERCIKENNLKF